MGQITNFRTHLGVKIETHCMRHCMTELYRCEISIGCNAKFCNFWMVAMATRVDRR